MEDSTCSHCGERLTRSRFRPTAVLMYGTLGVLVAMLVALLIVPVVIICSLVALFSREKIHVVKFEDHGGDIDNHS